jgi:PAS domain S-box-containing protein
MLGALTGVDYSWKAGIARPSPVTLTSPHTLVRLRGLLDLTRQARDPSDLADVLEAVSQVIAEAVGFGTVAVNVYRPAWDDFECAAVHGAREAKAALLGTSTGWEFWTPLLDERFAHAGAYVIPAGTIAWQEGTYVPEVAAGTAPDAWDPEDALLVPMHHSDGHLLGILSVDEPNSGLRPTNDELAALVVLATHAAQALEWAQESADAARHREALEQLFRVSARLSDRDSTADVLQAVCDGISSALGFRHVVVELADAETGRYRPAAATGVELASPSLRLAMPVEQFDAVFDPAFERSGCYLLTREAAMARVRVEPSDFASELNGRGPYAWNRNWLIVPLHDRAGGRIGFVWVDDPRDRLVPSDERLGALRLFADQAERALQRAAQLEELHEANEARRAMIEASPVGILVVGPDRRVRTWNAAARTIFGFSDEDVVGREPPWVQHDLEGFRQRFDELVESGEPHEAVFTDTRADGTEVDVHTSSAPVRAPDGSVGGVIVTITDITERERAKRRLARQNAELEALHATTLSLLDDLDASHVLEAIVERASELLGAAAGFVYLVDEEHQLLVCEHGTGLFAGFGAVHLEKGEGVGGVVWAEEQLIAVDDYDAWAARVGAYSGIGLRAVAGVPLRSGSKVVGVLGVGYGEEGRTFGDSELLLLQRFAHLASLALENARLYDAARVEVDERRQAEEALREANTTMSAIIESSPIAIFSLDRNAIVRSWNPASERIYGFSEAEAIGGPPPYLAPEEARRVGEYNGRVLDGETVTFEATRTRKDGSPVHVAVSGAPLRGADGSVHGILAMSVDVSERAFAEEALRKSQELYRKVVETSTDLVVLIELDGTIAYVSPSSREILGAEPETLVGTAYADSIHPDDFGATIEALRIVHSGGRVSPTVARVRHADGTWVLMEGVPAPVLGEDGEPELVLAVVRDVTERERQAEERAGLQEQLRQAQKMEAIGRLAGGIAHDFNNLVTAITGYGELALAQLPEEGPVRRHVEEMRRAGERAAELTRQLLAFSRKQVLQPKVLDLNDGVRGMEDMLRRVLGEQVDLSTRLDPALGQTKADPGQIEQVLLNLAINARDAMPRGGQLTIETANAELDEAFVAAHVGAIAGDYVMLAVRDTGTGMDRETLERVFEPFFTTKPLGEGTGLGLATVYGIVKQTGGSVWAYSEVDHGTTFKVYLPRVWEQARVEHEPQERPSLGGSETVLLVEDEDIVRSLVSEMLTSAGYRVLAAPDGASALATAGEFRGQIDVLMSDVVMPGMSGQELAGHLVRVRPGVRVLFTSGYTEDAISGHGVLSPGTAFLEKPFTSGQLGEKLRALLDDAVPVA